MPLLARRTRLGWIANWREMLTHNQRICRPRQIYTGENLRPYVSIGKR